MAGLPQYGMTNPTHRAIGTTHGADALAAGPPAAQRDAAIGDRRMILAIGAFAGALVVCLLTLFALRDRHIERQRAEELAGNTAVLLAEHAGRLVEAGQFLLDRGVALAGPPDRSLPTDQETHQELRRIAGTSAFVESMFLADAGGWNRVTSREWPVRSLNLAERPYFQALKAGSKATAIDRLETNPFTGGSLIIMARGLTDADGAFRGAVGLAVSVEYFRNFYQRIAETYAMSVSLVRSDGLILVRRPRIPEGVGRVHRFPVAFDPARESGLAWGVSPIDGRERLFSARRVPGEELWVVVGMDAEPIRERWLRQVRTYSTYAAVALGGILALTVMAVARARREALAWERLREANRSLEERVADRTVALTVANADLGAALKDKEVLFREVHHRVKNNLQVICSLLRLQADRLPQEARRGYEESLARIQSMSLVHELLYRSNQPSSIDFAGYARELAGNLADAFTEDPDRIRIEVKAMPLILDLDTAIPLGLLLTELAGNALKHGFPDGRSGTVTVTLRHLDGNTTLTVADDGVGLPDSPTQGGLGMMLVRSLASQIAGEIAIARAGDGPGTVARVTFPWPRLD